MNFSLMRRSLWSQEAGKWEQWIKGTLDKTQNERQPRGASPCPIFGDRLCENAHRLQTYLSVTQRTVIMTSASSTNCEKLTFPSRLSHTSAVTKCLCPKTTDCTGAPK